ncbi:MAG: NAD(P)/FAD-dependent oxidoreductase, partial [Clostridia bacterium]|nr:NAD(P)/FAD-dependent oxidoreductase [Clostridia bacterium]
MTEKTVLVVGGGPAGLMASVSAAERGAKVVLLERNPFCGKKLNITGKGRGNLTNACDVGEFLSNVPVNGRFLYSALSDFSPEDVMSFFESNGVPVKTERGRRVFPVSDRAKDLTDCLVRTAKSLGVVIRRGTAEGPVVRDGRIRGVREADGRVREADAVILAAGGCSYPQTGSDGKGYSFAEAAGHRIVSPKPSLVPLVSSDSFCRECMGLSLKNVRLRFSVPAQGGREEILYEETGEMLFTHFGCSGPVVLSASAHLRSGFPVRMRLDLKPALDEKTLDARLLREFGGQKNRDLQNVLGALLPSKMILPFLKKTGLDGRKKAHDITREERQTLLEGLKDLEIELTGTRPLSEAIVTSGGVDVSEVFPKTMESRIVK